MKKVLFCLSLIISLSVLGAVPSFAMDFTIDPATIGSIGDLGYGLAGGMELDFNNSYLSQKYKGEYSSAGTSQGKRLVAQKAANDFITNYAISRGLPLPSDASDYVENLPTDTYSYFKSIYFDNQTRSITNKAKLAGNDSALLSDALRFGIGPTAFADWASYSNFWYTKYLEIGSTDTSDINTPNPPADFSFISICGTHNIGNANQSFNLDDLPIYIMNNGYSFQRENFCICLPSNTNNLISSYITSGNYLYPFFTTAFTVRLYGTDGSYTASYENLVQVPNLNGYSYFYSMFPNLNYNPYRFQFYSGGSTNMINDSNFPTLFGGLSTAINYLYNHFRGCTIYVNDVLWCTDDAIDDAPADPLIPTFPDVIDPTSDDPAYTIDLPATDTGEGYFDITSLFDALVDAIEGALDDDAATDGVLDGTKGLAYEDEAGDAVNDDPIPDDDVIDDSIPDPTGMPNIPVPLPPIQDAFSGTTVLAQLVHATDVVMPDELMSVFWGILFILFIIGLIKVLHK